MSLLPQKSFFDELEKISVSKGWISGHLNNFSKSIMDGPGKSEALKSFAKQQAGKIRDAVMKPNVTRSQLQNRLHGRSKALELANKTTPNLRLVA